MVQIPAQISPLVVTLVTEVTPVTLVSYYRTPCKALLFVVSLRHNCHLPAPGAGLTQHHPRLRAGILDLRYQR